MKRRPWSRRAPRPTIVKAMASLIRSNERLAISLVGANEVRKEIEAVYKAGIDVGYFPTMPSADSIYAKPIP